MSELGLAEYFGMAEALGIIATLFVILYFSRKQMQSLSVDVQTKVLNDLDEKVRKMAEIIIEKPSMQNVIYKLEKPSEELSTWKQSVTDNIKAYFSRGSSQPTYQVDDFERLNKEHAEYVKKENEKRKSLGLPLIGEDPYKHEGRIEWKGYPNQIK